MKPCHVPSFIGSNILRNLIEAAKVARMGPYIMDRQVVDFTLKLLSNSQFSENVLLHVKQTGAVDLIPDMVIRKCILVGEFQQLSVDEQRYIKKNFWDSNAQKVRNDWKKDVGR